MAITVKLLDATQESNALPNVRGTAALSPEAAGLGMGTSVATVGAHLYQDELHRQDQVAFLAADRNLSEWAQSRLYDPQNGALAKGGKDTLGLPDEVGKEFQTRVDEIRKNLTTERQKVQFDRSAELRRREVNGTLSKHVFTEMRKFENTETENYIKTEQQAGILAAGDPERVQMSIDRQKAAITDFATRNGLAHGKDGGVSQYLKQRYAQIERDTHVGVITRFLSQGNDKLASDYFKENKSSIAGDVKVEQALKVSVTEGEGLRGAQDIWSKLGPKSDLDPVNVDVMTTDAEKKYADNPQVLKAVKQSIVERANMHNAAQRERSEANGSAVWSAIEKGGTLATIRQMPEYLSLPGKERAQIKEHMITRARVDKNWADSQGGDDTLYYTRLTEASSTPLQDGFMQRNLLEDRAKLSRTQFNHLVEVQASLRKGDTKNSDKLLASDRQQKQMVDEALLRMKLDPTPNEKTPQAKVEQITSFRRAVRESVSAIEQRTGKPATDAEVQGIVDGFVIEAVTKRGILWNDTKRVYQMQPGDQIIIKATDVPKAERAKIEDALRRDGRAVTDQAVTQLYQQRLYQLRRIPDPNAPAGK